MWGRGDRNETHFCRGTRAEGPRHHVVHPRPRRHGRPGRVVGGRVDAKGDPCDRRPGPGVQPRAGGTRTTPWPTGTVTAAALSLYYYRGVHYNRRGRNPTGTAGVGVRVGWQGPHPGPPLCRRTLSPVKARWHRRLPSAGEVAGAPRRRTPPLRLTQTQDPAATPRTATPGGLGPLGQGRDGGSSRHARLPRDVGHRGT